MQRKDCEAEGAEAAVSLPQGRWKKMTETPTREGCRTQGAAMSPERRGIGFGPATAVARHTPNCPSRRLLQLQAESALHQSCFLLLRSASIAAGWPVTETGDLMTTVSCFFFVWARASTGWLGIKREIEKKTSQ